jgi:hypothetical protein
LFACLASVAAARGSPGDANGVAYDNDNVVANRLPGKWELDRTLSSRLQKTGRGIDALEFTADDKAVRLIPNEYKRLFQGKSTYLAGMMTLRDEQYPYILIELHGGPHLVWFQHRGGEWVKLFVAAAEQRDNDLMFLGGNFSNQPFCAFRRAGQKPVAVAPAPSEDAARPPAPSPARDGTGSDLPIGPAVEPPTPAPATKPADAAEHWRLERASLKLLAGKHTQPVGNGQVTVAPGLGKRLVQVECRLTALDSDPQAIERIRRRRNLDSMVQIGGATTSGKYRMFDMSRLVLVGADGRKFPARWNVAPGAAMTVLTKSGQGIFGHDPVGWHGSFRNDEGLYVGLVEVGQTVAASFVFEVSVTAEPDAMSIQVEAGKPVPVKITVE